MRVLGKAFKEEGEDISPAWLGLSDVARSDKPAILDDP